MADPFESVNYGESAYNLFCIPTVFFCNYVRNGSFEDFSANPNYTNQINRACNWLNPTGGTPDFFSSSSPLIVDIPVNRFGDQFARTGSHYAGLSFYGPAGASREYITNRLFGTPLQAGNYYGEFYVALAEGSDNAVQNIGMYLTPNVPVCNLGSGYCVIVQNPQIENSSGIISDCNNWTRVSGCFNTAGGEKYLTIGNFRTNPGTIFSPSSSSCYDPVSYPTAPASYYYVEDVGLYKYPSIINHAIAIAPCSSAKIGPDLSNVCSTMYPNNSIVYSWSPITDLDDPSIANPTVTGNSSSPPTRQYTLTMTINGCSVTEDVIVTFSQIGLNLTSTAETCDQQSADGTATANVSAGTAPYSYLWSNGQTTQIATGLTSGSYSVLVTDANGCTQTATIAVSGNDAPILPVISGISYVCDDHQPYVWTYTIDPFNSSLNYTWTFRDASNSILISQSGGQSASINWIAYNGGLFGGTVTVTVSNNGCTSTTVFAVQNCCPGSSGPEQWDDEKISNLFPSQNPAILNNLNNYIYVQGTLVIDVNFTMQGVNNYFYMGPGSKILVKSGVTFTLNESILQAGCDQMWRGIELEPSARFISDMNSVIRDAEHAIRAHSGSNINLRGNTTFQNNYNCVYFPPSNNGLSVNFNLRDIHFTGGILIAPYIGQMDYGPSAFSGMIIHNAPLLNITNASATSPNIFFENLGNGIVAHNSNLFVSKTRFKDILRVTAYNTGRLWNGSAIYADGRGTLNQFGDGNLSTSPVSFDNCYNGIYTDGMTVNSSLNNMNPISMNGYFITNTDASNFSRVISNRIISNKFGVFFTMNSSNADILIDNNEVHIGITGPVSGRGITSNEAGGYPTAVTITNNSVYLENPVQGGSGIFLNSVIDNTVELNHIYLLGNAPNIHGISLNNSNSNDINCNHIEKSSMSTQLNNTAIRISMSTDNTINCNYMDKTGTGFFAFGSSYMVDKFSGNEFHNHLRGIDLSLTGEIGNQTDRGNKWFNNNYPDFGAYCTPTSGQNSVFVFPLNCPLPGGILCTNPSPSFLTNFNGSNNPWDCTTNFHCAAPAFVANSINGIVPLDYEIADNTLEFEIYEEVSKYETDRYLFEKIKGIGINTLSENFLEFYNESKNSSVGIYSNLRVDIQSVRNCELSFYKPYIIANDSLIGLYTDSMNRINNLLSTETNVTLIQQLESVIENLKSSINNAYELNSAYRTIANLIDKEKLLPIIARNQVSPSNQVHELNEKIVNDIYTKNILGKIELTSVQYSVIADISNMCPLIGGSAVYRARAILLMLNEDYTWDDVSICISAGITPRLASQKAESDVEFRIFPNPSFGIVNVEIVPNGQGKLILYDFCGRLMREVNIDESSTKLSLDLTDIQSSVIFYKYYDVSNQKNGKINIVR